MAEEENFVMNWSLCDEPCEYCPVRGKGESTLNAVGYVARGTRNGRTTSSTVYEVRDVLQQVGAPAEDLAVAIAAVALKDTDLCPDR